VADAPAPLLGSSDEAGDFIFPLPPTSTIDTLLLGCTHYPLLLPVLRAAVGTGVAIVDSATATASALVELLSINGLEAPATGTGAGTHRQLTTGDPAAFRLTAGRLFADGVADVEAIGARGSRHERSVGPPRRLTDPLWQSGFRRCAIWRRCHRARSSC
jgi:hypothetical protein